MKFIDLFAGLGGFHLALEQFGHECVLASEINVPLADLYEKNFGIKPKGDVRELANNPHTIPKHDILCAGFPCQPFSKAGEQKGTECPQWGDLFDHVVKILRYHKPKYLLMENVPNLLYHNKGETWKLMLKALEDLGYVIEAKRLSPHMFGVPQIRERVLIVGGLEGLEHFTWPSPTENGSQLTIHRILDENPEGAKVLPETFIRYLEAWQNFLDNFPEEEELPSFPIWAMEFGATYPYKNGTPSSLKLKELIKYKGSLGQSLKGTTRKNTALEKLPAYARDTAKTFPAWKVTFIQQNRDFYKKHKKLIDEWLPSIREFAPSFQKLEWNCKGEDRNLWKMVIQFRASGIRVKRPTSAPSLVALTTSQVPVITWEKRYMTMRECARLQSMDALENLPETQGLAYKSLGNAVNVEVVRSVASNLLEAPESTQILRNKKHSENLHNTHRVKEEAYA